MDQRVLDRVYTPAAFSVGTAPFAVQPASLLQVVQHDMNGFGENGTLALVPRTVYIQYSQVQNLLGL